MPSSSATGADTQPLLDPNGQALRSLQSRTSPVGGLFRLAFLYCASWLWGLGTGFLSLPLVPGSRQERPRSQRTYRERPCGTDASRDGAEQALAQEGIRVWESLLQRRDGQAVRTETAEAGLRCCSLSKEPQRCSSAAGCQDHRAGTLSLQRLHSPCLEEELD